MENLKFLLVFGFLLLPYARGDCPNKCVCKEEQEIHVECIQADLQTIPSTLNPIIQILTLNHNKFKEIGSASFQFHPELVKVDLADNQLEEIQEKTFEAQKVLRTLNLSNNKLKNLDNLTLYGLESVEVLDLSGNMFETVGGFVFEYLTKLKQLNLGDNNIRALDVNSFSGVESLQSLNLHGNMFPRVESEAFSLIQNLVKLNLSLNNISELKTNSFNFFEQLTELDLSGNQIQLLSEDSFLGLNSLKTLRLSNTNMSAVPSAALARLIRLEHLELNKNNFKEVGENAFAGLDHLQFLSISQCPTLRKVVSGVFSPNTKLSSINLSYNVMLDEVGNGTFDNLPSLSHLYLRDNHLTSVNLRNLNLTVIKTVDLSGNPWTCDCSTHHLQHLALSSRHPAFCAYPQALEGKPLAAAHFSVCVTTPTDMVDTSEENTGLVVSITVSVLVILTMMGALVFQYHGIGAKLLQRLQAGVCRRKASSQGVNYERSFQHQDTDCFVSFDKDGERCGKVVPVTEL